MVPLPCTINDSIFAVELHRRPVHDLKVLVKTVFIDYFSCKTNFEGDVPNLHWTNSITKTILMSPVFQNTEIHCKLIKHDISPNALVRLLVSYKCRNIKSLPASSIIDQSIKDFQALLNPFFRKIEFLQMMHCHLLALQITWYMTTQ